VVALYRIVRFDFVLTLSGASTRGLSPPVRAQTAVISGGSLLFLEKIQKRPMFFLPVVRFLVSSFFLPPALNSFPTPFRSPLNLIVRNPIMRLAREAPIPDRWIQGYCSAIKCQFPVSRGKRRDYFVPATAKAFMNSRSVINRNVQHAVLNRIGNIFYEFIRQFHRSLFC